MKFLSIALLLSAALLLAACNSLDNPFANLFHGNHDGRVFNPQTGQWDYPNGNANPTPKSKSAAVASALGSTPALPPPAAAPQQESGGGRYFDAQKNQWVEMHNSDSAAPSDPHPAASPAAGATPANVPPPVAPPRPAKDTGIYNPTTGKIEWQSSGGTTPSYGAVASTKPAPKRVKHWWWPF
jgi:hypothetical protein